VGSGGDIEVAGSDTPLSFGVSDAEVSKATYIARKAATPRMMVTAVHTRAKPRTWVLTEVLEAMFITPFTFRSV